MLAPGDYYPAVTFIIPCKNEQKVIADNVRICFSADYPKEKMEVIVINDGSTDQTGAELAKLKNEFDKLTVIEFKKNMGKRAAMVAGFKAAKGEIVIQLDSDSHIDGQTLRHLIEPFKNESIGAVCAHAEPANAGKNLLTKMQAAYYLISFRVLKAMESTFMTVFCCSGCSSAYRKSAVMPILEAWQAEMFLGKPVTWGEDRSLTSWILKQKYKTIYSDRARAFTIVPEDIGTLLKQQIRWKKSWIINAFFTAKFIGRTNPFITFFYFLPLLVVSFMTPFMTVRALLIAPLIKGIAPVYYVTGIFLLTLESIIYVIYASSRGKYAWYFFGWMILNMALFSYVILYSAIRLQDRGWGTR